MEPRALATRIAAASAFAGVVVLAYLEKWPLQQAVPHVGATGVAKTLAVLVNDHAGGGDMVLYAIVVLAIGLAAKSGPLIRGALTYGVAGLCGWLVWSVVRFVLAEARPRDGGAMHFFAADGHSVSGHAMGAALAVFVLPPRARAFAVAWALLVAWTRVALDMHFVWNVLLGLALGAGMGYAADVIVRDRRARSDRPSLARAR